MHVSAESNEDLQANFACNGRMSLYHLNDGGLTKLESTNLATISSNYTTNPLKTQVLAVRCISYRSTPWIMASVTRTGLVTDSRWKCFSLSDNDKMETRSWAKDAKLNDSRWTQAVASLSNREECRRGKVKGMRGVSFLDINRR